MTEHICEICGSKHSGSYGTGRFCSKECRYAFIGRSSLKTRKERGRFKSGFAYAWSNGTLTAKKGGWRCSWCDAVFRTKRDKRAHTLKFHPERCGDHPTAWNSGLTMEEDSRIKTIRDKRKKRIETGDLILKGHKHTEEAKRKISEFMQSAMYRRVCKKRQPYTKSDGSVVMMDSSYEVMVAKILDRNDIAWKRPDPLVYFTVDGKQHHYFPDFLLCDYGIYLDPKNDYCFRAQEEKIKIVSEHYKNVIFMHKEDINETFILNLIGRSN